jgi:hypothetical protein
MNSEESKETVILMIIMIAEWFGNFKLPLRSLFKKI